MNKGVICNDADTVALANDFFSSATYHQIAIHTGERFVRTSSGVANGSWDHQIKLLLSNCVIEVHAWDSLLNPYCCFEITVEVSGVKYVFDGTTSEHGDLSELEKGIGALFAHIEDKCGKPLPNELWMAYHEFFDGLAEQ